MPLRESGCQGRWWSGKAMVSNMVIMGDGWQMRWFLEAMVVSGGGGGRLGGAGF